MQWINNWMIKKGYWLHWRIPISASLWMSVSTPMRYDQRSFTSKNSLVQVSCSVLYYALETVLFCNNNSHCAVVTSATRKETVIDGSIRWWKLMYLSVCLTFECRWDGFTWLWHMFICHLLVICTLNMNLIHSH